VGCSVGEMDSRSYWQHISDSHVLIILDVLQPSLTGYLTAVSFRRLTLVLVERQTDTKLSAYV
jgi:hypothetical protein